MLFNRVLQRLPKRSGTRSHHPSPFDPQTTKGWKAAVKVSAGEKDTFNTFIDICIQHKSISSSKRLHPNRG
jgi:hypothetical protein